MITLTASNTNEFYNPIGKLLLLIPMGFLATLILLYMMHSLVYREYPVDPPKTTPKMPIINMDIPTTILVLPPAAPIKPVINNAPPVAAITEPVEINMESDSLGWGRYEPPKNPIKQTFGFGGGQMIPFIKIAPQYPEVAAAKGIEGFVDVMFDVTALGTTDNIRIIYFEPSAVFNRAVIKAVQGWRYKPREENGNPVMTPDVRDRIRFTLEK
jgi:periplasmic protein TonB